VKARQEAGGRRQEEDYYTVKAGFGMIAIFKSVEQSKI
jgi:hypothetical protein